MIHLQVLIYQMIPNAEAANLIAWLTFASLTLVAAFLLRSRSAESQSVTLALVSVLTLLPVYQQIYTAAVLVFVLHWAIEHWYLAQAKAAVMLMLALLLPLASMTWTSAPLAAFVARHHLSSYMLWNAFIMPHVIWIECTLALLMLSTIFPAYAGATSNQQIVKASVAQ